MFNIFDIEKKYQDELSHIKEWNYLRNYYREVGFNNKLNSINKKEVLKSILFGFKNWFKRYEYLFFSDAGSRRDINGNKYNIFLDSIIDLLGQEKSLLVEIPTPKHFKNSYTKNIVSKRLIDLLTILFMRFTKVKNIPFLDKLNHDYSIAINYISLIKRFKVQYNIYYFWFKLIKPKYIFLTCYYDKQYLIKAAHDCNIKIIEIQHGLITNNHSSYFGENWLDKAYVSDYLLVFGEKDKNTLKDSNLLNINHIYPIGSFYLDYLRNNFIQNKSLLKVIGKYKKSVGVSLQWTVEEKMIEFISSVAKKTNNVLYILIPRKYDEKYENLDLPDNMVFFKYIDCYNIIMHCDYHVTVYSTCAIEAPSLGIFNILVNIDNYTNKFLLNTINMKNSVIVDSEEEFISVLDNIIFNKENIILENKDFFKLNYKNNLNEFIRKLMGKGISK